MRRRAGKARSERPVQAAHWARDRPRPRPAAPAALSRRRRPQAGCR